MASLMSFRVDNTLKEQFLEAAHLKEQTQSEAVREALLSYVKRVRNQQMRLAAERIRANREDEDDAMRFIAAVSVPLHED